MRLVPFANLPKRGFCPLLQTGKSPSSCYFYLERIYPRSWGRSAKKLRMNLFRIFRLVPLFAALSVVSKPVAAQFPSDSSSASLDSPSTAPFSRVRLFTLPALAPLPSGTFTPTDLRMALAPASPGLPALEPVPDANSPSTIAFNVAPKTSLLVLPDSYCPSSDFGLVSACLFPPPSHFIHWDETLNLYQPASIQATAPARLPINWRSAFWQSFSFLVVGHGFRLMNDKGARYLLFHKPFWHDYSASADNFHMSRWGDGDSFIVNYIGHPMEGAVYGDIFINNDPKGRAARFGKSSTYWYSRLRAMGWATLWEAYFEIGPIFSETAIGNEGGYTYVPGCGLYPCNKFPGKQFKPPTNNTGWVDFVITPTVGMGWIILEDAIERELVDRISKGDQSLKWQMLRAGLAPSRSFANMFAGHLPWYRFPEDGSFTGPFGRPIGPKERPAWKDDPRFGLSFQYVSLDFPRDSESCRGCKQFYSGYGFDFDYRLAKYAWFDSAVNLFPGSGSYSENGGVQEFLAGFKFGRSLGNWGLYSNLRNGFLHYDKALAPGSITDYESSWRYALDLGGTVEYTASRNSVVRFNAGTTLVHYLQSYTDPKQPPTSVISTEYYSFVGGPYITTGYVYRF